VNAVELIGRMMLALGIVLGVMWLLAKWARRPVLGKTDQVLTVLARQQLNRNASVAVLQVLDRAIVVGVTDQGVALLAEAELELVQQVLASERPVKHRRSGRAAAVVATGPNLQTLSIASSSSTPADALPDVRPTVLPDTRRGTLDGSVLSPKTWKQVVDTARDLTVRR
jgi:flagellar protein FliO/FliZ